MASISSPSPLQPTDGSSKTRRLRDLVIESVLTSTADGILFSGGLDTSILASIASAHGRRLRAVMVSVYEGIGLDEPFARDLVKRLGIDLEILRPKLNELLDRMPELVRILRTFDPMELRNSIVTYVVLQRAVQHGLKSVLTGDAADELFAGYNFMFTMPEKKLIPYIRHLNDIMHFTSLVIGRELGITVETPYLAPGIRALATGLSHSDLVIERDGNRFGKRILREAFSDLLPSEIAWRVKTPIEHGSGSTGVKHSVELLISETEFERERQRIAKIDAVKLRDREQLFYYRIYRRFFGPPSETARTSKSCGECCAPVAREGMSYCRMCGAYPI